ncbi:MAG: GTPase [Chloroflexota bacterium]|nr:GTPase [Chloroflexota bacterium]
MPTNLPPEYFKIEERFRQAESAEEKIGCVEQMLSVVPKHKGTDKLRGDLRRRLSELKEASRKKKGAARQISIFQIEREGAGQVVVVGMPNVGKSALVSALTHATPEVANYPFTTWTPTPGMMPIEDIQVQLIDTPPLNEEHVEPEMINLIRRADLILLVVDLQTYPIQQLEDAVALLKENRIVPRHHSERYLDEPGVSFIRFLVLVNKVDDETWDEDFEVLQELLGEEWPLLPVSATTGRYFDRLKWAVFGELGIMRLYSKPPGKDPDLDAPFVIDEGSTVEEFAAKVHKDFLTNLKSARVWGSAEFDGQMVGRDYVLQDGDVVELRI